MPIHLLLQTWLVCHSWDLCIGIPIVVLLIYHSWDLHISIPVIAVITIIEVVIIFIFTMGSDSPSIAIVWITNPCPLYSLCTELIVLNLIELT
jgi:hypothetical protein